MLFYIGAIFRDACVCIRTFLNLRTFISISSLGPLVDEMREGIRNQKKPSGLRIGTAATETTRRINVLLEGFITRNTISRRFKKFWTENIKLKNRCRII